MSIKAGITKDEGDFLKKIDSIDINKDVYLIAENPNEYFEPFLKNIESPIALIFAKCSILIIIKKIDSSEELCSKMANYFLEKLPLETWLDTLSRFYEYSLATIEFIDEHHNNAILDLYNSNKIDKEMMKRGMEAFTGARKQLLRDKEDMKKLIADLEIEKQLDRG